MVPKPLSHDETSLLCPAVVVTTPYSSGCCIAKEIMDRGYKIICLWSDDFSEEMKTHVPNSAVGLKYAMELHEQATLQETASLVQREAAFHGMEIVAVVCGGEAGVDLADALSEHMGFLSNGTLVANRRDKKVQQDLIREAGLRAIRQVSGQSYTQEVEDFLRSESYPVIIKPLDSAGSDGVKKAKTFEEAKAHFLYLLNDHIMVNGGECKEVLCQEFLKGSEYVVDQVSRDGVHKTTMVFMYDKRDANGASFVYFGELPIDSQSEESNVLIPYARKVLDILGVANGPSHGEFIITEDGPCLVEMNCRAHGGNGTWAPLCNALTGGYSQINASADAYLDSEQFEKLPDRHPSPFKMQGQTLQLVSYKSGVVKSTPGYDLIKLLPSFVCLESYPRPGAKVSPTVDMATEIGSVVLVHSDRAVLERDVALIRQLQSQSLLFELEGDKFDQPALAQQKASQQLMKKESHGHPLVARTTPYPGMFMGTI